jgi:hypothetical protein
MLAVLFAEVAPDVFLGLQCVDKGRSYSGSDNNGLLVSVQFLFKRQLQMFAANGNNMVNGVFCVEI